MSFTTLGLSAPILKAIAEQGYDSPTPIQAQAIPAIIAGKDVMGAAQTGTGKTAGFTLPILQRLSTGERARSNHVRVLVLTPTRELAAQVKESMATYGKHLALTCAVVFGGVKINPQMMKLRRGVDILVATPGRLLDLYGQNALKFGQLEVLVLDEADHMLDMGFLPDISKIIALLPNRRQNLMFSATFSNEIRKLARGMLNHPLEISVSPPNTTVEAVEQRVFAVDKSRKSALLTHLIQDGNWQQVLVFARTKKGVNKLTRQLETCGIKAMAIHGDKSQAVRTRTLKDFKSGKIPVLVATDVAARGLDIDQLPHVINFDLPIVAQDYVHRIGRTGRAGASGQAISLVSADEFKKLQAIENMLKGLLKREIIDGFEPEHNLPSSRLNQRPIADKKLKKPKVRIQTGDKDKGKPKAKVKPKGEPRAKTPRQSTRQKR